MLVSLVVALAFGVWSGVHASEWGCQRCAVFLWRVWPWVWWTCHVWIDEFGCVVKLYFSWRVWLSVCWSCLLRRVWFSVWWSCSAYAGGFDCVCGELVSLWWTRGASVISMVSKLWCLVVVTIPPQWCGRRDDELDDGKGSYSWVRGY